MALDMAELGRIIEEVAATWVRPHFKTLTSGEVTEKSPGELVTIADRECESALLPRLRALVPGSLTIGEEETSADPCLLERLQGDESVWLVDPLDGTAEFAAGSPDHSVMVALVVRGAAIASVIHQPEHGRTFAAEKGGGAWNLTSGSRLRARTPVDDSQPITGTVMRRFLPEKLRDRIDEAHSSLLAVDQSTPPAGIRYSTLAHDMNGFTLYWRVLPWDHAPGALILNEAGGLAAHLDRRPYEPRTGGEGLLVASSPHVWERAASFLRRPTN